MTTCYNLAPLLASTTLPNNLILYLKELELLAVKSATASASAVHLVYIDKM